MGPFRRGTSLLALLVAGAAAAAPSAHARARPDLVVTRLVSVQTAATAGTELRAGERTRDRRRAPARRSVTAFYLSRDAKRSRGDVQIGTRSVPALRGRRSSVARSTLRIGLLVPAGTWHLIACADDTRRVRESNERNNCRAAKGTLALTAAVIPVPPLVLSVSRDGSGEGTVTSDPAGLDCGGTCSFAFPGGAAVTLTATPAAGARFAGWSGGCSGAEPTCAPTGDVTATFAKRVKAGVSAAAGGTASVASSDPAAACDAASCVMDAGADAGFTATPAAHYRFGGWTGSCAGQTASAVLHALAFDVSCGATFVAVSSVVWTVSGAAGGTVTGAIVSGNGRCGDNACVVDNGGSISLTRSAPASGWRFGGWSGNCSVAGTGTGLTFPGLNTDKSCGATFIQQFTITYAEDDPVGDSSVNAGLNSGVGSCTNGTCTVDSGSTVSISANPGGSSEFLGWTGTCTGTSNPYVLANVNANASCTAHFGLK
jgi:hypothetical protein